MSVESFQPVPIEQMGGLCTLLDPQDCPPGMSPDCRDVQFFTGSVRTRPGYIIDNNIGAGVMVNWLRTYINVDLVPALLMFGSDGQLWKETGLLTKTLISPNYSPNTYMHSTTLFGREWIANSTGLKGAGAPTVYDGNLYLVGERKPATSPTAVDAATVGSIAAGVHQGVCFYESVTGALSGPCATFTWTSAGNKKVALSGIPVWAGAGIGEAPVVARRFAFTGAGGAVFYYLTTFRIANNTATTAEFDFTENALVSGVDIEYLFRSFNFSEHAAGQLGVVSYARRLFWWAGNPLFGEPYRASLIRASRVEEPEFYDSVKGFMQIAEGDGQGVRSAFVMRDKLYFVKEHSIYVTEDDGQNEPNKWTVNLAADRVGTPSRFGVGIGSDWVVIAHRSGLYLFDGGPPTKLSQEIQPTWDSINWQYAHLLWVLVDTEKKRILVGIPACTGIQPNSILQMDYQEGFGDPIAQGGNGRKWAPWFIQASSADFVQKSSGAGRVTLGLNDLTGNVVESLNSALSDAGRAINSYWRSYYARTSHERQLFGYLSMYARGAGIMNLSLYKPGSVPIPVNPVTLANPATKYLEKMIRGKAESISVKLGTNAIDQWFSVANLTAWAKPDPMAPVRGWN